jgi:hypothetical protein
MVKIAPTEMSSLKQQRFNSRAKFRKIPQPRDGTEQHDCDATYRQSC